MAQKKTATKKNGNTGVLAAEIGAGVLAAAAAGAGYYFYGTERAAKHRRKAVKWANDMKKEVLKEAKKVQKLDKKAIAAIVEETAKAYKNVRSIDSKDLAAAANELKQNWHKIEAELKPMKLGKAKKTVKKAVKKVVKKAKKVAPKKASKKAAKKR